MREVRATKKKRGERLRPLSGAEKRAATVTMSEMGHAPLTPRRRPRPTRLQRDASFYCLNTVKPIRKQNVVRDAMRQSPYVRDIPCTNIPTFITPTVNPAMFYYGILFMP